MDVDQPAAVHVVEVVALAAVDDEIDALARCHSSVLPGFQTGDGPGDEIVFCFTHAKPPAPLNEYENKGDGTVRT